MLEETLCLKVRKTLASGITALLVSTCSPVEKQYSSVFTPDSLEDTFIRDAQGISSVLYDDGASWCSPASVREGEDDAEDGDDAIDLRSLDDNGFNYERRASPSSRSEEVLDVSNATDTILDACPENFPCVCDSISIIRGKEAYAHPVVSDYTVALMTGQKEVMLFDLLSQTLFSLAPLQGEKLRLEGQYLSGVYDDSIINPDDCYIFDLWTETILYAGECPVDIDGKMYVTLNSQAAMTVGDALFGEDLASTSNSVSASDVAFDYETVAFAGKAEGDSKSSIYLWKFVDNLFFPLSKPENAEDAHPLLQGNSLLFSRHYADGSTQLMVFDFNWDEKFALVTSTSDFTENGAFNGTSLASIVEGTLHAYNLMTSEMVVVDKNVDGGKPSIDNTHLVWTKNGALNYCVLKNEWMGEDF
ncbi:hypothetical protein HY496_00370 [Candidatus Woesearchaeota archaeon]|nr:hypothetical protein [Candidatus Woesearchaeota archaeon]